MHLAPDLVDLRYKGADEECGTFHNELIHVDKMMSTNVSKHRALFNQTN